MSLGQARGKARPKGREMTVVDSAAGNLAATHGRARTRIDGLLVLSVIVLFQLGWLATIGYVVYRVVA
jgi:hypothetical protein